MCYRKAAEQRLIGENVRAYQCKCMDKQRRRSKRFLEFSGEQYQTAQQSKCRSKGIRTSPF